MTKARAKKGSPLLLLVLVTLVIGTVGAAYVLWWQSGVVTHEITVRGMNAFLMPSTPSDYYVKTTAAVLTSTDGSTYDGGDPVSLDNCVVLAIDDALFDGDIELTSFVSTTYPGTISARMWFCTVGYLEDSVTPKDRIYLIDYVNPIDLPTDGLIPVVLTEAQALDIFWTDNSETGTILPSGFFPVDHINGVFIQFEFSGIAIPFGVYNFDITVLIDGDDGTP